MGVFDGLFGAKHAELDPGDPAVARIAEQGPGFESFVASANDKIEVVPGDGRLYAFVGKPPKAFGIVWFEDGQRYDVRSMMAQGAMTRDAAAQLVQELPAVYGRYADSERFAHKVGSKSVTVTPSSSFHTEVDQAVERARAR